LAISASAESREIKIGVLSGLNGAAAKWSKYQNMGMQLAQEEFNAKGWNVKLVIEDSETTASKAITAFNKLIAFDKVQAVVADDFGFVITPLLPLAKQKKKLLVTTGIPNQNFCKSGEGYFYSMSSQFDFAVEAYEQFFIQHPEVKKIALVVFDDPEWGNEYRKIWMMLANKYNIEVVDTFLNNEWKPDFKSALTKILAKKPDAILHAHEPESFVKAISQFNYKGSVVVANNVYEMLTEASQVRKELTNIFVVAPLVPDDFNKRFKERFSVDAILDAYSGYEALKVTLLAFEKNYNNPEQAIKSISYQGVAGPVGFPGSSCAGNQAKFGLFRFDAKGQSQLVLPNN